MTHLPHIAERGHEFRVHPLGYFFLQDEMSPGNSSRIHVWLDVRASSINNVWHQHSYDISSRLVTGKMRNELFNFVEREDGKIFEFLLRYESNQSMLNPTGRRGELRRMSAFEIIGGAQYWLEAGVIHRVLVDVVPCISIVSVTEQGAPLYSYGPCLVEPPFTRRFVDVVEADRISAALCSARIDTM